MIHWGVLGLGRIAQRFIKSLSFHQEGCLYAVASLTNAHQIEGQPHVVIYDDYEKLLDDPQVDAVYIALRHGDHYRWALRALQKGKAVLCEKPATLSVKQTADLIAVSKKQHVFFMEAMKSRFIPLLEQLKTIDLGTLQHIETSFCYQIDKQPTSYLFDLKQGGILYDVGSYHILMVLSWIHSPLKDVHVQTIMRDGIDVYDQVELIFESGQKASMEMAMDRQKDKIMTLTFTQGVIQATPFYRPTSALIHQNGHDRILEQPYVVDDFYGEIQEVHDCIKQGLIESPRMSHQDSLKCIQIMEMIKAKMKEVVHE